MNDGGSGSSTPNAWYEYKVVAGIGHDTKDGSPSDSVVTEVETDWMPDRTRAINLTEELRESGYTAQVNTRRYEAYGADHLDEVPESDAA